MEFVYPELNVSKKIDSIDNVRGVVYDLHDEYGLRGSNWDWKGAKIVDKGETIGRVAYNGRVIGPNEDF